MLLTGREVWNIVDAHWMGNHRVDLPEPVVLHNPQALLPILK